MNLPIALLALTALATAAPALAGDGYGSCYIRNGKAHAQFCSRTSDSDSGTGTVTSYDQDGNELSDEMMVWVGVAVRGCDEVGTVDVSRDAVSCSFSLTR